MTLTREERETIFRFDETQARAMLWTASPKERRAWERKDIPFEPFGGGWGATVDKRQISLRRKLRTLDLSPAQREARQARLARGREARSHGGNVDSNKRSRV